MRFPWNWVLRRVEKRLGKALTANRILSWSPRLLLGTGLMEALVVHDDPEVPRRLLKLVRVLVSLSVSCPFCIDLNSQSSAKEGVTEEELRSLAQGSWERQITFSEAEKAVLRYAASLTATPVRVSQAAVEAVLLHFSARAFVVLATTVSQVNLWARLIQGLGVNEAGFAETARWVDLDRFRTRTP